jgi:hypothetical protein
LTSETFDYTDGESSISTFGANGGTQYYSGPDGTGVPIVPPGTTTALSASSEGSPDGDTTTISASGQSIDLGPGDHTIQFMAGATSDTLVLHEGGTDSVVGFDPSAGDMLDLSALLAEANVDIGDAISHLANYVSVANVDGSAAILFDPMGRGGGSQVALLENDGGMVAQLQSEKAYVI